MLKSSHVSTVLTCLGAIGVAATSIMVAKAAPKASKLLEEAKKEKGEKLTKTEVVKTSAPVYIPAIVTGTLTIACIFGANVLNKRQQASLMSAYALLDNTFKGYRCKVNEIYGEDADERVAKELAQDQYERFEDIPKDEELLFYDLNSLQYFTSTLDEVVQKTVTDDGLECYIISTPFDVMPSPMTCW